MQPFIEFLKVMVVHGADPHATVDKLEFYRKLDEHKKHLLVLHEQRGANQVVADSLMNGD